MEVRELKFLLKLVALTGYKGKISQLKPTPSTKIADTEKICRCLRDRALVECQEQVTKFQLSSVGKALLNLNLAELPLSNKELKILQACCQEIVTPSQIKITPAKTRNTLIKSLIDRGLITVVATKIEQAWLTDRGKNYLLAEYQPQGYSPVLSLDLLNNYLCLFRQHDSNSVQTRHALSLRNTNSRSCDRRLPPTFIRPAELEESDFADEKILQTILDLDKQLHTHNYLPIFYLREKLQSFLSREELDLALYRLQRQDKLELSSIIESAKYTREQLKAGIPQNVGGCLFFLIVTKK